MRSDLTGGYGVPAHPGWAARVFLALIRLYQLVLSPLIGNVCRFTPSCSRYTATCVARFGVLRGGWMGVRRISRCHPFHPGGYDPPPELGGEPAQGPLGEASDD